MEDISLKEVNEQEVKNTFKWICDKTFRKLFMMQGEPDWSNHVNYFNKIKSDDTQRVYAIYCGEKHIGNCGFKYIKDNTAELWIYIGDANFRGKHLSKPACELLIQKGKNDLNLKKIFLHVLKTNIPAVKLYESLKFGLSENTKEDFEIWGDRVNEISKYELDLSKKETKVAMMQPSFMPWQGLFELILKSDKFVFLDDFQFVTQSHHTRNKLFVNKNQIDYYSVPVQKSKCFELALNEVLIVENNQWKNKLLRKMEYNYQKTPYFSEIFPHIKNVIENDYKTLAELNISLIKKICNILNIKTEFLYSSDFTKETNSTATGTKRVNEILDWAGSTEYLCAFGSFDYMAEDGYDYEKYPVVFQNYQPKPYKQIHSVDFVPYLSILDALFNIGAKDTLELIKNGTDKWINWEERKNYNL